MINLLQPRRLIGHRFCVCVMLYGQICCRILLCNILVYHPGEMIVAQMWPHVITTHIWDCLWISLGLPRDCHEIVNGLPWNCLGIAEQLAWDLRSIVGLLSGCRGVALGFANGLLWDWRGIGIAKGLPSGSS